MADPRGIAINISSRRPVYTDDPEYDKLLLALHAEQPDALQADELAHVQTLLPANFRSQNDPAADRARLATPDYVQSMGAFLGADADAPDGPVADARSEAMRQQAVRDRMAALGQTSSLQRRIAEIDPSAADARMSAGPAPAASTARMSARPGAGSMGEFLMNTATMPQAGMIRALKVAGLMEDPRGTLADQNALDALQRTPRRMLGGVAASMGAPTESMPARLLRESLGHMSGVGSGQETADTSGSMITDALLDPSNYLDLAKPVLAAGLPMLGKTAKLTKIARAADAANTLAKETVALAARGKTFDAQVGSRLVGGIEAGLPKTTLLASDHANVGRMLKNYPEIADDLPYMTAGEVSALSRMSDVDQGEFIRMRPETTRMAVLQAAAKGGEVKKGWYSQSRAAIDQLYAADAEQFAKIAAALSPRTSVESATLNAATFFENWREAGKPTAEAAIQKVLDRSVQKSKTGGKGVLPAWRNNITTSVQDALAYLSGPKVQQFGQNLTTQPLQTPWGIVHPRDAFTGDAWAAGAQNVEQARLGGNAPRSQTPETLAFNEADTTPEYLRVTADARKAGYGMSDIMPDAQPWAASEIQETKWSYFKTLYELAETLKMKAVDVVKQGLITDDMIAGTPDLTLLARGAYGQQLARDPAKIERMASILPGTFGAPTPTSPVTKQLQQEVAQVVDDLIQRRRMTTDFHVGRNKFLPNSVIATSPQEAQVSTSARMPALSTKQERAILAASQDALGRDPIAVALHGGTNVIPSESGMGVSKSERNPLRATGSALEVDDAGNLTADAIKNQQFASRFGGGMTMQKDVGWNATSFKPGLPQNVLHVTVGAALKDDVIEGIVRRFPTTKHRIIDRGGSLEVVRLDGGLFTPADRERLETYLETSGALPEPKRFTKGTRAGERKTPQVQTANNIAPSEAYTTMGTDAPRGSRTVTGNMMGPSGSAYDALSETQRTALDSPRVKHLAGTILEQHRSAATKAGKKMRSDVENLLTIIRDGGASALREAMKDPKQSLPVLAALGVYGVVGGDTPETETTARRTPSR